MTNSGYLQFAEALVFAQGPKAAEEAAKQASLDQDSFQALKLLPMLC